MSPLAHLLLALASATMLCSCADVPNMPNPCVDLEIGNKTLKLQGDTLKVEFYLQADLTKHLVDIPNSCGGMVVGVGAMSTLKHQQIFVCHLPRVHLYALGQAIYSPVVAYCEGVGCKNQQVKVLQYCQLQPIIPRHV